MLIGTMYKSKLLKMKL